MVFNATESITYDSLIAESTARYTERVTAAKGKVKVLEDHLNQLELCHRYPPPHTTYYAPERA